MSVEGGLLAWIAAAREHIAVGDYSAADAALTRAQSGCVVPRRENDDGVSEACQLEADLLDELDWADERYYYGTD